MTVSRDEVFEILRGVVPRLEEGTSPAIGAPQHHGYRRGGALPGRPRNLPGRRPPGRRERRRVSRSFGTPVRYDSDRRTAACRRSSGRCATSTFWA